jgi:hypothetical protein
MSISTKCGSILLKEFAMASKKGPLDPWQPQQLANLKEIWSMKSFLASRRFKLQVGH